MSQNTYTHAYQTYFDSLWLGGVYVLPSFYDLSPQITFQTALFQKENITEEYKGFFLKSYAIKLALKGFNGPLVYSFYSRL